VKAGAGCVEFKPINRLVQWTLEANSYQKKRSPKKSTAAVGQCSPARAPENDGSASKKVVAI